MTTPSNVIQYRRTGRELPPIPRNPDCSLFRTYERVVLWQKHHYRLVTVLSK